MFFLKWKLAEAVVVDDIEKGMEVDVNTEFVGADQWTQVAHRELNLQLDVHVNEVLVMLEPNDMLNLQKHLLILQIVVDQDMLGRWQ